MFDDLFLNDRFDQAVGIALVDDDQIRIEANAMACRGEHVVCQTVERADCDAPLGQTSFAKTGSNGALEVGHTGVLIRDDHHVPIPAEIITPCDQLRGES